MQGYYRLPEETAQALRNGWLHTGDMGRLDADRYLYIVERKKDLIIRGGFNIYPREVEDVLYAHPAVAEAAVVGVRDPLMGEDVLAFVALKTGATADAAALIGFCQERLAKYKCPKQVRFVDALPKSPIGKILRRERLATYSSAFSATSSMPSWTLRLARPKPSRTVPAARSISPSASSCGSLRISPVLSFTKPLAFWALPLISSRFMGPPPRALARAWRENGATPLPPRDDSTTSRAR
jgi:hypothetical protein